MDRTSRPSSANAVFAGFAAHAGLLSESWAPAPLTSALKLAFESAEYGVEFANEFDPCRERVMVLFAGTDFDAPHGAPLRVGVWLSPVGPYATAGPYPTETEDDGRVIDEGGWALVERISDVASGVADMHGWRWIATYRWRDLFDRCAAFWSSGTRATSWHRWRPKPGRAAIHREGPIRHAR